MRVKFGVGDAHACIHIYIYIYTYIHTYTHTKRHFEKHQADERTGNRTARAVLENKYDTKKAQARPVSRERTGVQTVMDAVASTGFLMGA